MADIFPIRPKVDLDQRLTNEQKPSRPSLAKRANFSLGSTLVLPSRLTLEGPLGSVKIEPRMMEVLIAFADSGGEVLTRADLMALCWPGMTVGDDSVNRVISGLRKAAAEVGQGFTIETVTRIGYRLEKQTDCAQVSINNIDKFDARKQHLVLCEPKDLGSSFSRRRILAGGTAAVSIIGTGYWMFPAGLGSNKVASLIEESRVVMRAGSPKTDREAMVLLEKAVELDPSNSDAWGLLALTRARMDEHAPPDKAVPPAATVELAANRALQLDKSNADAKAALAIAIPYYGNWYEAERRFDAVLQKHPDHLFTRTSRAFLLGAVGRMQESAREYKIFPSAETSFDAHINHRQIYALWFLNRIEEADRVANRGLQMWPGNYGIWFARLWVLAGTGRIDRALAQIDDEVSRPPLPKPMIGTLRTAMNAALSKSPSEVNQATSAVMAGVERSVAAVVNAMMLLNLMGAIDQAFALARAYYLEQGPIIVSMQSQPDQPIVRDQRRRKTNMLFTPLASEMRTDQRFMPLVRQMGLVEYWERRGMAPDFLK